MYKFHVGQRVRIVRAEHHPEMVGAEAIIILAGQVRTTIGTEADFAIQVPGFNHAQFACDADHIEPIPTDVN